jgi:hypothetical protein
VARSLVEAVEKAALQAVSGQKKPMKGIGDWG